MGLLRTRKAAAEGAEAETAIPDPIHDPASILKLDSGEMVADRYRIEQFLGAGGMAAVYRAHDVELEEEVALKFMRRHLAQDEASIKRFKKEIKLARRIVHMNICRTFDLGNWNDQYFVSMELIEGTTLEHWLESSPVVDLQERLVIFRGILTGLGAAHGMGIVHRDLKTQNIMVTPQGRAVIMDFGIAAELSAKAVTSPGDTYGTPEYMAPERLLQNGTDQRSDIYSLGVLLFELVTNQRPFPGKTIFEIASKQLNESPTPPRQINPHVSEELEGVILKLLAKTPEERYQSIDEVLGALPEVVTASTTGSTVLLVDDDRHLLTLMRKRLEMQKVKVKTAQDGASALQEVLTEPPDLICVDLHMPVMDGFDFLNLLKQHGLRGRIPVFMWSSVQDPQYGRQALRLGIEQFFSKPLDFTSVAGLISERLRTAS